ncbi:ABC transporter substrate-binding protein [Sphingobium terrigena]|uniref:ABC transporter substrate-binding protein n=1 Tax=Sphingobium terrigena TaxID=2304063 RepID=A0A418YYF0_9SPHN|nr:ABC transporter substrate-binding protein [Sphingobium terrigena]RJG57903.1 ABC transporter substrate-binding protein [Sphingobium terrigena]
MAADKIKLVGGAQGFNWLPVFVAIRKGMFADAGIEVELERLGSVDKATAAVAQGEAHLAITPPEGAVTNFVSGGPLRIVASNSNRLPMSLVARPEIRTIADLRGQKIGTSSLTEGTAIYTQIMLAEHGLAYPGDYEFALAGIHTTRWDALQKGEIAAAPQPAPWNFLAQDQGYRLLGEVSDYIPEILFAALIARQPWIDAHRPVLSRLLGALDQAYDFVNDPAHEAENIDIFQEITTKDSRDLARRGYIYMRDLGMWPRHMAVPHTALATTVDLMVRAGLLAQDKSAAAMGVFQPDSLAALAE